MVEQVSSMLSLHSLPANIKSKVKSQTKIYLSNFFTLKGLLFIDKGMLFKGSKEFYSKQNNKKQTRFFVSRQFSNIEFENKTLEEKATDKEMLESPCIQHDLILYAYIEYPSDVSNGTNKSLKQTHFFLYIFQNISQHFWIIQVNEKS